MTTERTLRCYDYVNQSFQKVTAVLHSDAVGLFTRATNSAAAREHAIGVQLRVRVGALDVSTDVRVDVGPVQDTMSSPLGYQMAVFPLRWSAVSRSSLFPHMKGKLSVYPLSPGVTQLEFEGSYHPPLGWVGDAIDAVVGHRIAEASVLEFLHDISALLRTELGVTEPS